MSEQFDFVEASVLELTLRGPYTAEIFSTLKADDFSTEIREPMQAAYALFSEGKPVDVITVAERLESTGHSHPMAFVAEVLEYVGKASISSLGYYAKVITSRSLYRKIGQTIISARQWLEDESPETAYERILTDLNDIGRKDDDQLWDMKTASKAFIEEMQERNDAGGELIGLSTGFKHLDNRMNGMRPGDMIVIAGRPGMGKSTLAFNVVEHNAVVKQIPTLVFSLEMSAPQIMEKMTASLGHIDLGSLRKGTLTEDEWTAFSAASQRIQSGSLRIDDRGGLSIAQIRARCFEVQRRYGLELVVIDYIGLMSERGNNRNEELTKISQGIKRLAKDLQCPVIALSQLNRGVESRPDKRPHMSDLRESGAIEQDADVIIFPYREGYYDRDNDNPDPLTEIIFGKIRMGEPGSEGLEWQGKYSRFVSMQGRPDFELMRKQKEEAERTEREQGRGRRKASGGMDL